LTFVAISMVGALVLVSDLMFDGAVVVGTGALALLGCVICWCVMPLLRRRALRTGQLLSAAPTGGHTGGKDHDYGNRCDI
jgi:drug/metabolite transporter (DMT)-like permease